MQQRYCSAKQTHIELLTKFVQIVSKSNLLLPVSYYTVFLTLTHQNPLLSHYDYLPKKLIFERGYIYIWRKVQNVTQKIFAFLKFRSFARNEAVKSVRYAKTKRHISK